MDKRDADTRQGHIIDNPRPALNNGLSILSYFCKTEFQPLFNPFNALDVLHIHVEYVVCINSVQKSESIIISTEPVPRPTVNILPALPLPPLSVTATLSSILPEDTTYKGWDFYPIGMRKCTLQILSLVTTHC